MRSALAIALLASIDASAIAAQRIDAVALRRPAAGPAEPTPRVARTPMTGAWPSSLAEAGSSSAAVRSRPGLAPVLSAVAPGTGQVALGLDRAVVYLAFEGFVWLEYAKHKREFVHQTALYRQLARDVARADFGPDRPEGNWDYYEKMEHKIGSGRYNYGTGTNVIPETDTSTANGEVWQLARDLYWGPGAAPPPTTSDAYRSAIAYYLSHAIRPEFAWSWHDAQLEFDLYRRTINKRNDASTRTVVDLSLLLANHLLSSVDAFATIRLRAARLPGGGTRVSASLPLPGR